MRLSEDVVDYFKDMARDSGVPCQRLINLYLRDCVTQRRKVRIAWPEGRSRRDALVDLITGQAARRATHPLAIKPQPTFPRAPAAASPANAPARPGIPASG